MSSLSFVLKVFLLGWGKSNGLMSGERCRDWGEIATL